MLGTSLENAIVAPAPLKIECHATVHDIPVDDRPRERLQKHGAESLSNPDLIAIILRNGSQRDNVIELANKILIKYGGLSGLMSAGFHELCNEYGLGMAKAAQLKAARRWANGSVWNNQTRNTRFAQWTMLLIWYAWN